MNKLMEKEIEDNIKGMGYKNLNNTLDEEGKILKDIYLNEGRLDTSLIYKEEHKEVLKKIYKNRIEKQKININFQSEKISTLISTVSFTNINDNILDELPIQKTIRIFTNIKNIYLFHTKATSEYYLKIKEKLTKDGYNVIGEEVDETLTEIRKYLHKILRESLNKNETIVDITAGIKISSISMYKFAVENGIRAINWKEINLPRYDLETKRTDRIVFSTKLEILKEAMEENRQILTDINVALDREEYDTLARYYDKLDRKDEAFFFENLAKIFNFETFLVLDPNNFYEKVKVFLNNVLSYKFFDKKISKKIKPFILLLKIIADTDEDGFFDEKFLRQEEDSDFIREFYKKEIKNFEIIDEDFIDYDILKDKDENLKKRELYYYLVLQFLERKCSNVNLTENILESIKEKVLDNLKPSELDGVELSFNAFYEKLFNETNKNEENENFDLEFELKSLSNLLDIKEKFKEILKKSIVYNGENILKLEDYNIIIDFSKEKEFEANGKIIKIESLHKKILKVLIESKNYSIRQKELKEILCKNEKYFISRISSFRKFKDKLNEAIRRKIGLDDFIMIIKNKNITDNNLKYTYKINEKFF